jgi:valyl-tRNA synthetase
VEVFVDLAGLIDVEAEVKRLSKENEKLAGLIAAKRAKLESGSFAAKAPPAVVAKEREQLAEMQGRLEKAVATLVVLRGRS